ncbi:MAG: hypothetical protein M1339_07965 [Bacteroidetes bacterium]|nr:hypothetical protein [Bacteroidota bacterium]
MKRMIGQGLLIVVVFLAGLAVSSLLHKPNEVKTRDHLEISDNRTPSDTNPDVTVSQNSQELSGISTEKLIRAKIRDRVKVFGQVLDLQGLIGMESSYAIAEAAVEKANAQIGVSRSEYIRVVKLFDFNKNVSQKDLQIAEAAYISDQADSQSAAHNLAGVEGEIKQHWGSVVFGWIEHGSSTMREIAQRKVSIFLLVVPAGSRIKYSSQSAEINLPDGETMPATLVSASPRIDPSIQGKSYFYKSSVGQEIASGTNVVAYLSASEPTSGVLVPYSAVVWVKGSPWIYIKTSNDTFAPLRLSESDVHNGKWLLTSGAKAGQEVVVRGAQLILSRASKIGMKGDDD